MQVFSHDGLVNISSANQQDDVSGSDDSVVNSKWVCTEVPFYCTWVKPSTISRTRAPPGVGQ